MAQRVLNEVQRQIDGMLEYRLREALTPILARTSEALVREPLPVGISSGSGEDAASVAIGDANGGSDDITAH